MNPHRRVRLLLGDSGQAVVEYAIILGMALLGAGFALLLLRDSMGSALQNTSTRIGAVAPGGNASAASPSEGRPSQTYPADPGDAAGAPKDHGNGKGNSGQGKGNGGPNGRKG